MDKLRTPEEAAERMDRTPQRVYQLIDDGTLAAVRVGPGKGVLRIRESVLAAYIESMKIPDALPPIEEVAAA